MNITFTSDRQQSKTLSTIDTYQGRLETEFSLANCCQIRDNLQSGTCSCFLRSSTASEFSIATYPMRNEPRSEKTGLRGFRPGPTQTGLYGDRRWLEA